MPTKTRATKAKQTRPAKTIALTPEEVIEGWTAYFQLRRWIRTHHALLLRMQELVDDPGLPPTRNRRPRVTGKSSALDIAVAVALWTNYWSDEEAKQYHRFQHSGNGKR